MDSQALQDAYNNAGPSQPADASQSQAQDITIPAQAVAQITQFIQQNDCTSVCKIMAGIISGGSGGSDSDSDDSQ